jgi:probable phosphoglycerate mutase
MQTTFLLIRHGATSFLGKTLSGRSPGVSLNEEGQRQAQGLVERLAGYNIACVYSSPLERTVETATPLATARGLEVTINEAFAEIDFGEWAGKTFEELEPDPIWHRFNSFRSGTRVPGGETMLSVQARVTHEMERLRHLHKDQTIAVFTHSDVIKSALLFFLGMPMDFFLRLEIVPASISEIYLAEHGVQIRRVNA